MKTRALTKLLSTTATPALLLTDNSIQWHNSAFDTLAKPERQQIEHWGQHGHDELLVCHGMLFERLTADDHTLVIASGHRAPAQQRQLMQALLPQLQHGTDPFFALPQILAELLQWQSAAACKHLHDGQLSLVGHWSDGQQQPPRTLKMKHSLAAPLYDDAQTGTRVQEWEAEDTHDPLLPEQGIWLGQRIDNANGQPIGHLAVWGPGPQTSMADSIHLLQLCADLVSAWSPSAESKEPPAASFIQDRLTGLPLRDALDHALTTSEQHYRNGKDYLLALIDIDALSEINTRLGQQEGDRVLCAFADKLRHVCRPNDQLFRFGGDEFVLLLPAGSHPPPIMDRLQQINRSMSEQLGHPFNASVGLAKLDEVNGSGDELLLLADSRLQQDKRTG
ncbi:diguanylate cyclase (GGDEF)-like protein [Marinobacterium halophilum]|uniref:diguanylate cyclase n=1 Tax=Marinobacterium halophilum TaxID=267374 RepID=A0A2P8F0K6_9GAMM|nr:GGDEF domain-containing protein [Marinobacterium halophilum]PSL15241.1 diguanylate cyclase (GGDEF)-like protein [Marinobacterium halophilum]